MTEPQKYKTFKYGIFTLTLCLLIWQIIDIYLELKAFPSILGKHRNYLILTVTLTIVLYFITNHKDLLIQHIMSTLNVLLSLYNWIILGIAYKIAPKYIQTVTDERTIIARTIDEAVQSMKVLLIVAFVIIGSIIMWYSMVVYHNKVEKEDV